MSDISDRKMLYEMFGRAELEGGTTGSLRPGTQMPLNAEDMEGLSPDEVMARINDAMGSLPKGSVDAGTVYLYDRANGVFVRFLFNLDGELVAFETEKPDDEVPA